MRKTALFVFVLLFVCLFGYAYAATELISGMRQYDGTYTGVSGTGSIGYSVLYRDNEDNGTLSGCNGEGCGKHPGIDILASSGSSVYAAFGGTVARSECNGTWGGLIVIQSTNPYGSGNIYTTYAHLKQLNYSQGNNVSEGAVIGLSGGGTADYCHGNSTGPHLHFQIDNDADGSYPWFPSTLNDLNSPDADFTVPLYAYNPMPFIYGWHYGKYVSGTYVEYWDSFGSWIGFKYKPTYPSPGNPYACSNEPTHDQNWWYSCTATDSFTAGDTAYGLLRIDEVYTDFRFRVKAYKNDDYQWEWTADWNDVGSGWNTAFFWVTIENIMAGDWELRYYIDTGTGFVPRPMATQKFTVTYSSPYLYDGNGYTCANAPTHDENWWYSCTSQNPIGAGNTVYGLVRVDQIYVDFRFKVETYKNGNLQWQYTYDQNYVGDGWTYSFFWPQEVNASVGNWEFRIFVITGSGTTEIKRLYFQVN